MWNPRTCGEKAELTAAVISAMGSPPRRRGKGYREFGIDISDRITPAQAGKSVAPRQKRSALWDHPRVGGEKYSRPSYSRISMGSPPRGRGKVAQKVHKGGKSRITPAWAGKSKSLYSGGRGHRDHPRMGGEKHAGRFKKLVGWGSPPHGRGKVQACPEDSPASGITPAWAGKRQPRRPSSRDRRDHPRMGGEKPPTDSAPPPGAGSPPHGRGKAAGAPVGRLAVGITPAWAGKRSTPPHGGWCRHNHPRMGGEKMPFALVTAPESGSPPHGRGKVNTVTNSVPSVRITPAWAGKSDR